jgi:hypothetical protein
MVGKLLIYKICLTKRLEIKAQIYTFATEQNDDFWEADIGATP